jgi:hypothetical protein
MTNATIRRLAGVLAGLETLCAIGFCLLVLSDTGNPTGNPIGFEIAMGMVALTAASFLLFTGPALFLVRRKRRPILALILSLAATPVWLVLWAVA